VLRRPIETTSIKGAVKRKHNCVGWNFSWFAAHGIEQDLFNLPGVEPEFLTPAKVSRRVHSSSAELLNELDREITLGLRVDKRQYFSFSIVSTVAVAM
jgi:hypothetical protein